MEHRTRNSLQRRQLLEELWTKDSEVTEALWDAAISNLSQGKQIVAFLLDKCSKVTKEIVDDAVAKASQISMIKLLLERFDDKILIITDDTITNAAGNAKIGSDLVEEILKINPSIEVPDGALKAAAGNQGCGAKVMKLLLTRKPLSDVKETNDILVPAAQNTEQVSNSLVPTTVSFSNYFNSEAAVSKFPQDLGFKTNSGGNGTRDCILLVISCLICLKIADSKSSRHYVFSQRCLMQIQLSRSLLWC